jgi:hypothetical protein
MILVIEPFKADHDDLAMWNAFANLSREDLERSYYAEALDKGLRRAKDDEPIKLVCHDRRASEICASLLGIKKPSKLI